MAVYPPQSLTAEEIQTLVQYTEQIAKGLPVIGLLNIQYVLVNGEVYVLEVNPRASRTVPIISKVTGVPLVDLGHPCTNGYQVDRMRLWHRAVPKRQSCRRQSTRLLLWQDHRARLAARTWR